MEVIIPNKDRMKEVVKNYRGCGHKEYYGMIYWRDGLQFCRQCIYEIWQKETNYEGWKPEPGKDFVFPYYEDGIDYSKEESEYETGTSN